MGLVFRPPQGQFSPSPAFGDARIDWSHPILNGVSYLRLFSKQPTTTPDFINRGSDGSPTISGIVGIGPGGLGLTNDGLSSATASYVPPQTAGTFVAFQTLSWSPTDGTNHVVVQVSTSGGSNSFIIQKYVDNNWYSGWNASADHRATGAASSTFSAGDTFSFALTWATAAGTKLYTKGVQRYANALDPLPNASSLEFSLGKAGGATAWTPSGTYSALYYAAFWDRVLGTDEIALLAADPYCFLTSAEGEMPALFQAIVQASGSGFGAPYVGPIFPYRARRRIPA